MDNPARLYTSDNFLNFQSPIDSILVFAQYTLKVLAGSGSGEPSLDWQRERSRFRDQGIPRLEAGNPKRPAPTRS